jgi:hypothetical protein
MRLATRLDRYTRPCMVCSDTISDYKNTTSHRFIADSSLAGRVRTGRASFSSVRFTFPSPLTRKAPAGRMQVRAGAITGQTERAWRPLHR